MNAVSSGRLLKVGLLLAFTASTAHAHLPEYFGRKYVLMAAESEPLAQDCVGDREALRERAGKLRAALDRQALVNGAYGPELAEPMGELGKLYTQLCNHPAALESNRRAIQLLRISEGLQTLTQIPNLYALADSYRAIGDYRSAQQTLRLVFRLHGMGLGQLDAAALQDSLRYFSEARSIYIDPRARGDLDLFFDAFTDSRDMLESLRSRKGLDYATRETVSVNHLYNLYLLLGTDLSAMSTLSRDAGTPALNYLQRSQMLTYSKGKKLLEELIDTARAQSPGSRAMLYFRLANWQQWNGKWTYACDNYAIAWKLSEGEGGEALRKQLASAAELPEDPALWVSLQGSDVPVKSTFEAAFRVSARGNVSRVDTTILSEGDSGGAGRLSRWLRDSHARPAVVDGICVESTLSGRRYRLLD